MTTYPSLHPTYLEPDGQEFFPSWLGSGVEIDVELKTTSSKGRFYTVETVDETLQIYLEGILFKQEGFAEYVNPLFEYKEIHKNKFPLKATLKRINFNND